MGGSDEKVFANIVVQCHFTVDILQRVALIALY